MTNDRTSRGFTVVEAMVVMAIIGVLAALALPAVFRQRPRAYLAAATAELQSVVHGARQHALATGHDVWVVVFPEFVSGVGTGRVIIYEDGNFDFSVANAPGGTDLARMVPATPASGSLSRVVTTMDLPAGVTFGVEGSGPPALPKPLNGVDVTKGCSFCGTLTDHRGGIRFDSRGRASFYGQPGIPLVTTGAALSLTSSPAISGQRTLIVTPITGAVRLLING
jgi:prepilin-type N-terminal cleavage/methylation domain-containing protein